MFEKKCKKIESTSYFLLFHISYALSTFPDLKQLVHTCILLAAPFTMHFTFLTFEFQIALDLL